MPVHKYIFALVLLGLVAIIPLRAQTLVREELNLEQASQVTSIPALSQDQAISLIFERVWEQGRFSLEQYLQFQREGNFAAVHQDGTGNTALLSQTGLRNVAVIQQQGNGITTQVLQDGFDNAIGAWLTGDDHRLDVRQIGSGNLYLLDYSGNVPLNLPVVQQGEGNRAVQTGSSGALFGIEQHGSGMEITVTHN